MLKQTIICDRCGKECEHIRNSRGRRIFRNKFYMRKSDDDIFDLCQECYDSLANWWVESQESEEQTE